MTNKYLRVRNWERFQQYKDRRPTWIKIYVELLDDYKFGKLPDSMKAHLVGIWLLAAQTDNKIAADVAWITRKINATEPVDVKSLISFGFLQYENVQNCTEDGDGAYLETETYTEEKETEKIGVYAHAREASGTETDHDETDRLDDDIAFEEKRFNTLALAIGTERIQAVLDSIPRPKNVGAFSASRWLATGRTGIGRSEQAMTRLRLTCDGLEHWQREQSQPYMTENTRKSMEAIQRVTGATNDPTRSTDWARALKGSVPVHEVR